MLARYVLARNLTYLSAEDAQGEKSVGKRIRSNVSCPLVLDRRALGRNSYSGKLKDLRRWYARLFVIPRTGVVAI